ncbi:MAG: glycosyltransferase family 2 protein [archaeon]|nr:glycosyltransferase family 2 protein [archaeon]
MKIISIVIPCYNSEHTIDKIVNQLKIEFSKTDEYDYEIVLVNDNSPDNTFGVIKKLCSDKNIIGINFSKNFGQHSALMAGLKHTSGDLIVCMDDDGQTPPNQIFKLINSINDDVDVVYARYNKKKHSAFRNFGTYVNSLMLEKLLGKDKDLFISSYFVAKRFVIDNVITYENPYPYLIGLVLGSSSNIINVDIDHQERSHGESGYTFSKLLGLWINGFTSFSVKPLRIALYIGAILGIVGLIGGIYIIIRQLISPYSVEGWASLITVILFSTGIIVFTLGAIGEYVGRIFISINKIPQYVIKEEINVNNKDKK